MDMKNSAFMFIVLLTLFYFNNIVYSQSIQSLQIEFERYIKEENREEIIKGVIYYQTSGNTIISVKEPINQWLILKKNGMDIYYPTSKKVIRYITKKPITLPFFQSFLGVMQKDYGLMGIGYKLSHFSNRGDTLFSYWKPRKILSKEMGNLTIIDISNKINYSEIKNPDESLISKSYYSKHIDYDNYFFPLEIYTTRYMNADSTFEKITYKNPQFNSDLPKFIKDFKIPPYVRELEFNW